MSRRRIVVEDDDDRLLEEEEEEEGGSKSQDADYDHDHVGPPPPPPPQLVDELEAMILARVPRSEYGRFCAVNKRFNWLVASGEVYNIRRRAGLVEPTVFMLAAGAQVWWAFDRRLRRLRNLPELPAGDPFRNGDKETLCAGTHLLVSGKEDAGAPAVWRYSLVRNRWLRGPPMINPRSLFAAATSGLSAYVAGGLFHVGLGNDVDYLSSAERYNSESGEWEILPSMHRRRKNCSGCYMDEKFYVVGGRNDEDGQLTCGEAYDEAKRAWELIPDMLEAAPAKSQRSPPLIAVVHNDLYSLDVSTNLVKVYVKADKRWRSLGPVPVVAGMLGGWGVAFKSLGDELLVIGGNANAFAGPGLIFACRPDPAGSAALDWRLLENEGDQLNPFILNCSVMFA